MVVRVAGAHYFASNPFLSNYFACNQLAAITEPTPPPPPPPTPPTMLGPVGGGGGGYRLKDNIYEVAQKVSKEVFEKVKRRRQEDPLFIEQLKLELKRDLKREEILRLKERLTEAEKVLNKQRVRNHRDRVRYRRTIRRLKAELDKLLKAQAEAQKAQAEAKAQEAVQAEILKDVLKESIRETVESLSRLTPATYPALEGYTPTIEDRLTAAMPNMVLATGSWAITHYLLPDRKGIRFAGYAFSGLLALSSVYAFFHPE